MSTQPVDPSTPLGANLVAGGATFRVWAPAASAVHVCGDFNGWTHDDSTLLARSGDGYWGGFVPGVSDGARYKFWVVGAAGEGYKRDPYARELTTPASFPGCLPFPYCDCVVRDPAAYPWHDQAYRPPAFDDLVIYQLHVGTYYATDAQACDVRQERRGTFLDLLFRLDYLVSLGVNAVQPLPIAEYPTPISLGYNATDLFSPESDYGVSPVELPRYVSKLNELLARRGHAPVEAKLLASHANQLRALIDVFHAYGIAVLFDVVYNHGGGGFDAESLYFLDREVRRDDNDSLYFLDRGWAGGLAFALWKAPVRQFLIDNATFFAREYHVDGLRFDEVSALLELNRDTGWGFCQDLTSTLRSVQPRDVLIAESWPVDAWIVRARQEGGAGFDATWSDGLRDALRSAISAASAGDGRAVGLDALARALGPALPRAWSAVQCIENHDLVYRDHPGSARVARLADPSDPWSWYARSRARFATALLLTAPGIPMLFMGQELLEDEPWSDDGRDHPENLIRWDGVERGQKVPVDHLRFTQDAVRLRRRHPALRGEGIAVFHVHEDNRVIAFHRWLDGVGRDVVVVASLRDRTWWDYELGLPGPGRWLESFNSDVYDGWVNPWTAGNGGGVDARGGPLHGMPASARVVIPANGVLVFTRDAGDP
jgi:1,4-alpha-glucan branching enzyme